MSTTPCSQKHVRRRVLLIILVLLPLSQIIQAQERRCGSGSLEVILHTINTGGNQVEFSAVSQSHVWNELFNLTSSYTNSSVNVTGDYDCYSTPYLGWDFVFSIEAEAPVVAYALYKIQAGGRYFYLDYRDCRFDSTGPWGTPDVWIRFDDELLTFSCSIEPSESWVSVTNGETVGIWEIFDAGSPNLSKFQPTDPSNLSISNYGGHPKLTWTGSEPSSSAKYIVYRNSSAITDPPLSSLSYVDEDITLGGGFTISYKVRAVSGDGSKYSTNYSNTVSTQGWYSKPADTTVAVTPGDRILTGNFPNPFNPETRITFALNERSHVHLLVYDVLGREVARLIDGDLDPGNHEAAWRGSDQNGRKLPSGMYVFELQHRRGTERMKMMLVR